MGFLLLFGVETLVESSHSGIIHIGTDERRAKNDEFDLLAQS